MLREARRRVGASKVPVQVRAGDGAQLRAGTGSVDACRADTLLQHLTDPAAAIAEIARVTRPGGRIAVLDFDQDSTVIDHPDTDTTTRLRAQLTQAAACGRAGRSLRRWLADAALAEITVRTRFVDTDFPLLQRLLAPATAALRASGDVPAETLDRWWATLAELWRSDRFYAGACAVSASATVPGAPQAG